MLLLHRSGVSAARAHIPTVAKTAVAENYACPPSSRRHEKVFDFLVIVIVTIVVLVIVVVFCICSNGRLALFQLLVVVAVIILVVAME